MDIEMLNKLAMHPFGSLPEKNYHELYEHQNYLVTCMKQEDSRIIFELDSEFQINLPDRISRAINNHYDLFIELSERVQRYNLFIKYHGCDKFEFTY